MWQRVPSRISQTQRPYRVMGNRGKPSGPLTATDQGIQTFKVVLVIFLFYLLKFFSDS